MEIRKYLKYIIPLFLLVMFLLVSSLLGIFYANIKDTIWTWANSVTLFGIGFASSISLYGLLHSSEQFNKQIKHSDNHLEEQFTRKYMEEAIFEFFSKIISIINEVPIHTLNGSKSDISAYDVFEHGIKYNLGNSIETSISPMVFRLSNNYFKELIHDNPFKFYYLPPKIRELIVMFDDRYNHLIINIENSIDDLINEKTEFKNLDEFLSKKK